MAHPSIYKETQNLQLFFHFSSLDTKKKKKEPICIAERTSWSNEMETRTRGIPFFFFFLESNVVTCESHKTICYTTTIFIIILNYTRTNWLHAKST